MAELRETREAEERLSVLDLLLRPEAPNVLAQLPTKRVRLKRLSKALGRDVVFTLRALPYGKVQSLRGTADDDLGARIVLAGTADPDLKNPALREKFGGATPADTLAAMLLPGEIEDLQRTIERLSGYRGETIDEVKNA